MLRFIYCFIIVLKNLPGIYIYLFIYIFTETFKHCAGNSLTKLSCEDRKVSASPAESFGNCGKQRFADWKRQRVGVVRFRFKR